jgi:type II secretory pathway pseudopilin PulG
MIHLLKIIGSQRVRTDRAGFTLIEIILYVALSAIVLVALMRSMLVVLGTRDDTRGETDLHYTLRYALDRIRRTALDARELNVGASSFLTNSGVLSLAMSGATKNPTVFSLSGSRIYAREASGSAQPLTPTTVKINQFYLRDLSAAGAPATIQILLRATDATLNVAIPRQMQMRTSATLRQ